MTPSARPCKLATMMTMAMGSYLLVSGMPLSQHELHCSESDNPRIALLQHKALAAEISSHGTAAKFDDKSSEVKGPEIVHIPVDGLLHNYAALDTYQTFMNLSNLVHSNLGGQGPDGGAEEMRFADVYPLKNATVDLIVKAVNPYQPKVASKNGVQGGFGQISMRGGKSTTFRFKFVEGGTSKPVTLNRVLFAVLDVDRAVRNPLIEEVSTEFYEAAFLSTDTTIQVVNRTGGQPPVFRGTALDSTGWNNPTSPTSLGQLQVANSVAFSFVLVSSFDFTFSTFTGSKNNGRNLFFSGIPVFPICINTSESAPLTFTEVAYSNIAGKGPNKTFPEGMRFVEVFKLDDGQIVDLIVTALDGGGFKYKPARPELNGVRDGFGSINMETKALAKFLFKFVDAETDLPVTLKDLMFSWLDLDGHPRMADFQEAILLSGFDKVLLSNDTSIVVQPAGGGLTKFASTEVDRQGGARNPDNPAELTPEQQRRAFTVRYPSVSQFEAIIDYTTASRKMPRSMYFHGQTRLNNDEEIKFCTPELPKFKDQ